MLDQFYLAKQLIIEVRRGVENCNDAHFLIIMILASPSIIFLQDRSYFSTENYPK